VNLLRHIGIAVSDIEKALFFYRDLLGFKIIKDMEEKGEYIDNFSGVRNIVVRTVKLEDEKGSIIELLKYKSHPKTNDNNLEREITDVGISHFALTVDDIDETYKKLIENGISFNCLVQNTPDGYARVTFCRDFDGNFIEIVEVC
jgi:catechol 2,3-dioxygenase-like lactoylglutathione lyase family enzyme